MKSDQEIILLGSSLISLINAYLILKRDPNTMIRVIDSNSQIGGAWYSDKSPMGAEIECGCHIWSYCPDSYNFIENEFNIKLSPFKSPPIFKRNKISVPYQLKSIIDSYRYILKNMVQLNFKEIKALNQSPKYSFQLFNKKNLYPNYGSPALLNKILELLKNNDNFQIILNEQVKHIDINERVTVTTQKSTYHCDKIFTSSTSTFEQITVDNNPITFNEKSTKTDYIHYLISLDRPVKKTSSYIRLTNDHIIHRIADISYQTDYKENLILFGIKQEGFNTNSQKEILSHIKTYLTKQQMINKGTILKLIKTHIYPTFYTNQSTRKKINSIDKSKIELIHSTDLMHGIYYLLKR